MSFSNEPYFFISIFFLLLAVGFAAVSLHYKNRYEEVMELWK